MPNHTKQTHAHKQTSRKVLKLYLGQKAIFSSDFLFPAKTNQCYSIAFSVVIYDTNCQKSLRSLKRISVSTFNYLTEKVDPQARK